MRLIYEFMTTNDDKSSIIKVEVDEKFYNKTLAGDDKDHRQSVEDLLTGIVPDLYWASLRKDLMGVK